MNFISCLSAVVIISLSLCGSASANLINISFGGVEPDDESELISSLISSGFNNGSGVYWEDFDNLDNTNCGLTQFAGNITGSYSLTKGLTKNQAAPPAGDESCFMVTPELFKPAPGEVEFNFTSFLTSDNGNMQIDYLGFYWGSIDGKDKHMNSLTLYDINDQVIETEFGDVITGKEILTLFNGQSGNQYSKKTNLYVNFDMSALTNFYKFSLKSSKKAFEIDNVVIRTSVSVAEPVSLTIFSLGIFGIAAIRRCKTS
jgi:hypothetical protein